MTLKRRIIVSSMVATVALSALSLSITLAWYASSDRLSVSAFEIGINASHNLLISTSTEEDSFKERIEKDELNGVDLFVPASSMHKNLWMDEMSDTPMFYDNSFYNVPSTGIPQIKEVKRGYFQQKIYLRSDFTYNVTLSLEDSFFKVDEEANQKRAELLHKDNDQYTVEEYKEKLDNLINALRLSILVPDENCYNYFIYDPFKKEGEVINYAGRLDNDNDGYYDTYEYLDHGQILQKETVYGEVNDRDKLVYNDPTGELVNLEERNHYDGNSFIGESNPNAYSLNEEESFANGASFVTEDSISPKDLETNSSALLIPCEAGIPREIVMSIYLEGWDPDCINATMGASFINEISFKLAKGGN